MYFWPAPITFLTTTTVAALAAAAAANTTTVAIVNAFVTAAATAASLSSSNGILAKSIRHRTCLPVVWLHHGATLLFIPNTESRARPDDPTPPSQANSNN